MTDLNNTSRRGFLGTARKAKKLKRASDTAIQEKREPLERQISAKNDGRGTLRWRASRHGCSVKYSSSSSS